MEEAVCGKVVKDSWHQGREITLSKGTSSNLFRSLLLFFEDSELLCKTALFFFRSATLSIFQALDLDKFGVAFVLELSLLYNEHVVPKEKYEAYLMSFKKFELFFFMDFHNRLLNGLSNENLKDRSDLKIKVEQFTIIDLSRDVDTALLRNE